MIRADGAAHEGRTRNVSRGGVCADLAGAVPVGTDIDVDLALVFDEALSEPLRLPGRIVWCTMVDEGYQVGIAFRPLSAELTGYLDLFLRYLHDTRSEKPSRHSTVDDRFR